jgi:hypothetical protein
MCGIVGLINRTKQDFWLRDLELFEQMLVINSLRGKDSVGAFSTYRNNQVEVVKLGSNVFNLFKCQDWDTFKTRVKSRGRFLIGHNRAATRGAVNTENAHPFVEEKIILVHNGTLLSHEHLSSKVCEVDSNAIAHALSEKSLEEVLPRLHGAFALVWYDTEQRKLFAVRNDQRPLCVIRLSDMYVLSSEPGIAMLPIMRQDRKVEAVDDVEPWTLFEFAMDGTLTTRKIEKKTEPAWKNYKIAHQYSSATREAIHRFDEEGDDDVSMGWYGAQYQDCRRQDPPFDTRSTTKTCALTSPSENNGSARERKNEVGPTAQTSSKTDTSIKELDSIAYNNTRSIQIPHPRLTREKLVLFKPIELIHITAHNKFRFRGKLHETGEMLHDVIGYFPEKVTEKELMMQWIGKYCMGRVLYVSDTTGGISVYLKDAHVASTIKTFGNAITPLAVWSQVMNSGKCCKCGCSIKGLDKEFTSITMKGVLKPDHSGPVNEVQVTCADCIERTLTNQIKNEFIENRNKAWKEAGYSRSKETTTTVGNSTVQTGEQLSEGTGKFRGKIIELPGSTTLQ